MKRVLLTSSMAAVSVNGNTLPKEKVALSRSALPSAGPLLNTRSAAPAAAEHCALACQSGARLLLMSQLGRSEG